MEQQSAELVRTNAADIEKRQLAQTALANRQRQLAEIQAIAHCGSWERDIVSGKVIWSDELYRIFGLDPDSNAPSLEIFLERVHPENRAWVKSLLDAALRDGIPFAYATRIVRPDGGVRYVSIQGAVVREDDRPVRILGLCMDVTEQKRMEHRLQESEEHFRSLIDGVRDYAIFMLDPEGRVASWNPGAEAINGYQAEEIIGRHFSCFYPPADIAREKPQRELIAAATEGRFEEEGWRLRKDSSAFFASVVITPLRDVSGRLRGFAKVVRDITERRQTAERLLASREQLRALAARLQAVREDERGSLAREVHDQFGQVLTAVRIDLTLLEQSVREGPCSKISREAICAEVASIKGLVDQAINSVKQIAMELRPLVLDELGLIAALEWQAGEFQKRTGIPCRFKSQVASVDVDGDRAIATFRIFQEALTNIVRHAQAKSVSASISEHEDGIVLEICDNGVGIDEREVTSSKSLGLIGMRERALVLGGEVTVNGVKGHGTTVRVRIPVPAGRASLLVDGGEEAAKKT